MTTKSDRRDGDGLSREQITEYVRELNTIAAECEITGTAELSRAAHNLYRIAKQWFKSLPARDVAEGARQTREYQTSHGTVNLSVAVDAGLAAMLAAAPPKPAPDALREGTLAGQAFKTIEMLRSDVEFDRPYREFLAKQLDAALSAPVPPADGANELGSSEPLGPHYDGTTMDNQQLHGTTRRNQPVVTAGETAPPPATGAAEPVATPENAVYQKITGPGVDALENRKEQVATSPGSEGEQ